MRFAVFCGSAYLGLTVNPRSEGKNESIYTFLPEARLLSFLFNIDRLPFFFCVPCNLATPREKKSSKIESRDNLNKVVRGRDLLIVLF